MRHSTYRRDIDGLRAFAVLSVIFYHARVPGFSGGFAGVDIFFVISGFLIGGHIGGEVGGGAFTLAGFYERRIRRIFPALFFVCAAVLLAATVIEFPPAFARFHAIALYIVPFLANFAIYKTLGAYSGAFAQNVPLLHIWSLAVEEQFYVLFPILMIASARFARQRYWLVLAPITLLSFFACVIAARMAPLADFYLPPFRAWELLMGALLALARIHPPRNAAMRACAAALGLVGLAASDLFLHNGVPFPSEYALLPCVAAALILHAECDSAFVVGRILDNPVTVNIGLWSYSLYLIHWPLLTLTQYYVFDLLSPWARGAIIAASIALAALSWRFIEQPFRSRSKLFNRHQIYVMAATASAVLLALTVGAQWLYPKSNSYARDRFPAYTETQRKCWDLVPAAGARSQHLRCVSV